MRIAVIGFGAAAIGLLERLKDSNHELHVFEKATIYTHRVFRVYVPTVSYSFQMRWVVKFISIPFYSEDLWTTTSTLPKKGG